MAQPVPQHHPSHPSHPSDRTADTVDEFCDALRIGRTLFYGEVAAGRIRPVKAGRRTLVPRSEREAWLRRLRGESA
jgi:excisionase family DNA binding protein